MDDKKSIQLSDIKREGDRHILDSPDKIIFWIKHQFEEQKKNSRFINNDGNPIFPEINLSKCIISTHPHLTNLCDILKENDKEEKLDCFINNEQGNKFFQEVLEDFKCDNSIFYGADFAQTKFHKSVNFQNTIFEVNANFSGCHFMQDAFFNVTKFKGQFDFTKCSFESIANFSYTEFDVYQILFDNSIFNNEFDASGMKFVNEEKYQKEGTHRDVNLSFRNCVFHNKFDFSKLILKRFCDSSGSEFFDEITIVNSYFKKELILDNCKIHDHLYLLKDNSEEPHCNDSESYFSESISLRNSILYGRIDIENCIIKTLQGNFMTIKSEGVLRISESKISKILLRSSINNGIITLDDNKELEEISLANSTNNGSINFGNPIFKSIKDRKTAYLMKDTAIKNNNYIDSIDYKAKEMEFLEKETNRYSQKGVLLFLNKLSNRHGTDWWRAVVFTLACWIGSYLLFLTIARIDVIHSWMSGQSVKYTYNTDILNAFKYLWTVNLTDIINPYITKLKTDSLNDIIYWIQIVIAVFILVLGKISIAYGIYQTISAFRKYGK